MPGLGWEVVRSWKGEGCFHFFRCLPCWLNFLVHSHIPGPGPGNGPLESGATPRLRRFAAQALRSGPQTADEAPGPLTVHAAASRGSAATCDPFLLRPVTGRKRGHSSNTGGCNPKGVFSLGVGYNLHFFSCRTSFY